ncbi:unnamed protein product, partial [Trichogramma brassicae]
MSRPPRSSAAALDSLIARNQAQRLDAAAQRSAPYEDSVRPPGRYEGWSAEHELLSTTKFVRLTTLTSNLLKLKQIDFRDKEARRAARELMDRTSDEASELFNAQKRFPYNDLWADLQEGYYAEIYQQAREALDDDLDDEDDGDDGDADPEQLQASIFHLAIEQLISIPKNATTNDLARYLVLEQREKHEASYDSTSGFGIENYYRPLRCAACAEELQRCNSVSRAQGPLLTWIFVGGGGGGGSGGRERDGQDKYYHSRPLYTTRLNVSFSTVSFAARNRELLVCTHKRKKAFIPAEEVHAADHIPNTDPEFISKCDNQLGECVPCRKFLDFQPRPHRVLSTRCSAHTPQLRSIRISYGPCDIQSRRQMVSIIKSLSRQNHHLLSGSVLTLLKTILRWRSIKQLSCGMLLINFVKTRLRVRRCTIMRPERSSSRKIFMKNITKAPEDSSSSLYLYSLYNTMWSALFSIARIVDALKQSFVRSHAQAPRARLNSSLARSLRLSSRTADCHTKLIR